MHNRQIFDKHFKEFVKLCKISCVKKFFFHLVKHINLSVYLTTYLPHLALMLHDVVWDIYRKDSLKLQNRQNLGVRNCLLLSGKTSIQINWKHFQRVDTNVEGLFQLLAIAVQEFQQSTGKTMISTLGELVVSPLTRTTMKTRRNLYETLIPCLSCFQNNLV